MTLFLNRNDKKWPCTYSSNKNCRSKSYSFTVGNYMENETWTIPKMELKLNVKLSENELN